MTQSTLQHISTPDAEMWIKKIHCRSRMRMRTQCP